MTRHINLLDPPKKVRSPYATALQMGVPIALVLLVMGSWAIAVQVQLSAVKRQLGEIEAQMRPVSEQLSQLQAGMGAEQVNAGLRERLQHAQAQLRARKDIQTALRRGDLGSTQGFSEAMRAFARQTVSGVWLTHLRLDNGGREITVRGRALDAEGVATLVRRLRAEPAMRGRSIATLRVDPATLAGPGTSAPAVMVEASQPAASPHVYEFELSSTSPADGSAAPASGADMAQAGRGGR